MTSKPKSRILKGQQCSPRRRAELPKNREVPQTSKGRKKIQTKGTGKAPLALLIALCFSTLAGVIYLVSGHFKEISSPIDFSVFTSGLDPLKPKFHTAKFNSNADSSQLIHLPQINSATILEKIRAGDTLETLLSRVGAPQEVAAKMQEHYLEVAKQQQIVEPFIVGRSVEVDFSLNTEDVDAKIPISDKRYLNIFSKAKGRVSSELEAIQTMTRERVVVGAIKHSFSSEGTKAGLSYEIIDELVDLFGDRIAFHKDFRKGDRFTVIFNEERTSEADYEPSGPIVAAAFQIRGQTFAAIHFIGSDGKGRYFNENGELLENTFLRFPLKFSKISSHFSSARFHPVLKRRRPHNGVDFAAPTGTPVRTTAHGTVVFAGRKGGHGIMVEIKHTDRFTTGYSHLSKIGAKIKRGATVVRGQEIGAVGMTGLATGPHLHFSLYDNGRYVDPLKVDLPQAVDLKSGMAISKNYLTRALFTLRNYQSLTTTIGK